MKRNSSKMQIRPSHVSQFFLFSLSLSIHHQFREYFYRRSCRIFNTRLSTVCARGCGSPPNEIYALEEIEISPGGVNFEISSKRFLRRRSFNNRTVGLKHTTEIGLNNIDSKRGKPYPPPWKRSRVLIKFQWRETVPCVFRVKLFRVVGSDPGLSVFMTIN